MKKRRIITILPFKMEFALNGYASGLVMKRDLTFREANHIAKHILGIETDLTWIDFTDDKEELKELRQKLVEDISNLIKGNVGFDYISDEWCNGDALEDLIIAIFFNMLNYLSTNKIV